MAADKKAGKIKKAAKAKPVAAETAVKKASVKEKVCFEEVAAVCADRMCIRAVQHTNRSCSVRCLTSRTCGMRSALFLRQDRRSARSVAFGRVHAQERCCDLPTRRNHQVHFIAIWLDKCSV